MASAGMVIKQGYLYRKRERTTSKVLKKPWQYGYFLLMESPAIEGLLLEEYKDASLKMLKQSLVLGAIKHVGQVWTSKSKQFAFEIVTMGKLALMLACENESSMNEWMRTFSSFMWTMRSSPEGSPGPPSARNDSDASGASNDSVKQGADKHGRSSVRTGTNKAKLFEVKVQQTRLSVSKQLDGTYLMQITKSRVILKTLNGKTEVLSWPLDQLRGFKSHPELHQVFFEIGRRCHFGEGRLAFHTRQSEEIVEIIRRMPLQDNITVEGRRDSYKANTQRHSSSSSFESDYEKRKEPSPNEESMCTVHVSGSHRKIVDKIVTQTPLGLAVQKRHHTLRKQSEICSDTNGEEANEVFEPLHDFSSDDKLGMKHCVIGRERVISSESNEVHNHRGVFPSPSVRGSDTDSFEETIKLSHRSQADSGIFIRTPSHEDDVSIPSMHGEKGENFSDAVDQDGDSQSYLELVSENPPPQVESEDDDEKLLSKVVGDLTNPQRPREQFINFKSASTGGIENTEKSNVDQGRRASAPCTSGHKIGLMSLSDEPSPSPTATPEDKYGKHISPIAKRMTKLEDIEEVCSFDNETINIDKEEPVCVDHRPRSLSDSQPKKHTTLKENGRSVTCDASISTCPSEPSSSHLDDHTRSQPASPYKKNRESDSKVLDSRSNGGPLSKDPLSKLMFPKTKTPSFPKTLFRPTRSLGLEIIPPDGSRAGVLGPMKRELPLCVEPEELPVVGDVGKCLDSVPDQAPEVPPKVRSSPSLQSFTEPPIVPKRAPLREKSISRESDNAWPQPPGRPYVNTPPPLTPRRPDAVPLSPISHSKSSECIAPPPRPPKPSVLAPLESTRSLPPFASGVEINKKGGDSGRCISPLTFDSSSYPVSISPKLRTSPDGEHHLRSSGPAVKWRVASVTPPRSPIVERTQKRLLKDLSYSDSNIAVMIKTPSENGSLMEQMNNIDSAAEQRARQMRSGSLVSRKITSATSFLKKYKRHSLVQVSIRTDKTTEKRSQISRSPKKMPQGLPFTL